MIKGSPLLTTACGCAARQSSIWVVVAIVVGCSAQAALAAGGQPNIVLIMSDDAGYNEFGFTAALNGQTTQFETPNLDALAQQSVVARQGYTAHPLCSPSRAGLLTGQYPQRFGFETNLSTNPAAPFTYTPGFTASNTTIAQHLKGLGYSTGMVGKWHTGYIDGVNVPLDKGFDEFFGLWSGARHYFADFRPANAIRRGDDIYEAEYRAGGNPDPNDADGYDPVNGRYVTDAFGDESADFIRNHAGQQNPFFLYMAPTSPHDPYEAKQQDLAHFSHIADTTKRTQAAMTYAMDRAIGKVISALDDPNNDGDTSDSVRNNTIIVYLNDNGGPPGNDNLPFRGTKGLTFEGGIRVPFVINAPGLQAGTFDAPISSIDVLPTFYAAAGGNVSQLDTDGVDLMPHLSGANSNQPHEVLFWRNIAQWGVRKGDWKLGNPNGQIVDGLFNIANDPGETTNVAAQNPEIVADLLHDFTEWEAKLDKPRWELANVTPFDHVVWRVESFGGGVFSQGVWKDAQTQANTLLHRADGYANLILEFPVKQGASYGTSNNLVRLSGQSFMLNELRFTGTNTAGWTCPLGSGGKCAGTIGGLPFLLVKSLAGNSPKIRLEATSSTQFTFRFDLNTELELLDDLEIIGNGTQDFFVNGAIRDFGHPRSVVKSGTSHVTLTGNNTFKGNLQVNEGQVRISGANAAVRGAESIVIGSAGSVVLDSGTIATHTIDNSAGGNFQFNGGELKVVDFVGNLTNQGGNYSPGASPALSTISGNYVQSPSSMLTMEIAGSIPGLEYDKVEVNGSVVLEGTLQVELLNGYLPNRGDSYLLFDTIGGVTGAFTSTILPALPEGLSWRLDYSPIRVRLLVDPQGGGTVGAIPGDYNGDGTVDAADYVVWRNTFNSTIILDADGDKDGTVDDDDYVVWQANFGNVAPPVGAGSGLAGVPEPGTWVLASLAVLYIATANYRRPVI